MLTVQTGILIVAAIAVATFLIIGPAPIWSLFGPADLGPVEFETLQRRTSPNDALACPNDLCKAASDLVPPVFAVDARTLRQAFAEVIGSERNIRPVGSDETALTQRYVQTSALLGFPDTIVVRFIQMPGSRSSVAIYSRSQLGRSDFGVNKARIERWLEKLKQKAAVAR